MWSLTGIDPVPGFPLESEPSENRLLRAWSLDARAKWTGVLGLSALFLFAFDPSRMRWSPPCPIRTVTGLLCPGCGSLRAVHQLLHFRPVVAFRLNPLLMLALPIALGMTAVRTTEYPGTTPVHQWKPAPGMIVGVLLAFGIVRNTRAGTWLGGGAGNSRR